MRIWLLEDELERERIKFQEEITGVRILRLDIVSTLERLRLETDKLHSEEHALREREENLTLSFERLQEKEIQYKDRGMLLLSYILAHTIDVDWVLALVHAIVQESRRIASSLDGKREHEIAS